MKDIKNEKFEIDNYFDFTIIDDYYDRWEGKTKPYQVNISIGSKINHCSIVEVKYKDFDSLEKFDVIQVAENCTKEEILDFIEEKYDELKKLLFEKIKYPSSNGQC